LFYETLPNRDSTLLCALFFVFLDLGRPSRERFCPIDAPDDFFRVRLCCTLLDTCGMCFDRGSAKKKLDSFLIFFQVSSYFYHIIDLVFTQQITHSIHADVYIVQVKTSYGRRIHGDGYAGTVATESQACNNL